MKYNFGMKQLYILYVGLACIVSSCNFINPDEQVPCYFKIDSMSVSSNNITQGSSSSHLTEAWVDVNDERAGAFPVPNTFPILVSGSTNVVVSAGILDNGSSGTRTTYPFYNPYEITLSTEPTKIYELHPLFTYRALTKFPLIEDFELGNVFSKLSGDTILNRISGTGQVYEGSNSGQIYLDDLHPSFEGKTLDEYVVTGSGSPVYIELDYKCNIPFTVGIYGISGLGNLTDYRWNINPKTDWNKIYLNLTDDVASMAADKYQIMIKASKADSVSVGEIYLDNIKLLTY